MTLKIKKTTEDIKKGIIRFLLKAKFNITNVKSISDDINSNWLTTKKFLEEMEKDGIVKLYYIEDKLIGVQLNYMAIFLLHEVILNDKGENTSEFLHELLNAK